MINNNSVCRKSSNHAPNHKQSSAWLMNRFDAILGLMSPIALLCTHLRILSSKMLLPEPLSTRKLSSVVISELVLPSSSILVELGFHYTRAF